MSPVLLLTNSAHRTIESDCLAHGDNESGGVLPGRKKGSVFLVPFSIGAGPAAMRTPVRFSPDSTRQQAVLDFLFEHFQIDYQGDWHRHPDGYDRPSEHDLRTARRIVTDPSWNKEEALFPIATVVNRRVHIRAYLMRRVTLRFEEIAIEIVPDTDQRMMAVLFGQEGNTTTKEAPHAEKDRPGSQPGDHRIRRVLRRAAAGLRRLSPV